LIQPTSADTNNTVNSALVSGSSSGKFKLFRFGGTTLDAAIAPSIFRSHIRSRKAANWVGH
jgi:hypothetical protein